MLSLILKPGKLKTIVLVFILATLNLILLLQLMNNLFGKPSYAQATPCINDARNEGLISGKGFEGTGRIGNTSTTCVLDSESSYRDFKVPTYDDLENEFYSLSRSTAKQTNPLPNGAITADGNGIYLQTTNMTVSGASTTATGVKVIFIRGNLDITDNIPYAENDPYSGLVFIASGNINIYSNVTKINAILISATKEDATIPSIICTAYILGSGCPSSFTTTQQLVINGSLISLNKITINTPDSSTIRFVRDLTVSNINTPAELINKQAKYLYILRNGILTKDLIVTQEDSKYSITPDPGPAPPAPPAQPPPCQVANPWDIGQTNPIRAVSPSASPCIVAI